MPFSLSLRAAVFLSTPSVRRATPWIRLKVSHFLISIHALREEGDQVTLSTPSLAKQFLSTPSVRRATPHRAPGHRPS